MGNDWKNEDEGFGVKDGMPYGLDPVFQRQLDASTIDFGKTDYSTNANAVRVASLVSETQFNDALFPIRNKDHYDYANFI